MRKSIAILLKIWAHLESFVLELWIISSTNWSTFSCGAKKWIILICWRGFECTTSYCCAFFFTEIRALFSSSNGQNLFYAFKVKHDNDNLWEFFLCFWSYHNPCNGTDNIHFCVLRYERFVWSTTEQCYGKCI